MSEVKRKCKYKCRWTDWECPYEALEDSKEGFCIFHDRRKNKDIKKFNKGIEKILHDKDSDGFHFNGFFFPDSVSFAKFKFKRSVYFCGAEFIGNNTDFWGAKFSGAMTDFCFTKFLGEFTDFSKARFSGEDTWFAEAIFLGKTTDFRRAEFLGENTNFRRTKFSGIYVNFYFSIFMKKISFERTIFEAKTNFTGVDLRKCVFKMVDLKNVDFTLIEWDWKHKLGDEVDMDKVLRHKSYFQASEIYQQLKVQFHNKRDFAKAGMFHFREQECKRMACRLPKDFIKWIFLWILKLSCGYGEKLSNVGLSTVALILIFGVIYMFLGLHATDQAESLIFQYKLTLGNPVPLGKIISDYLTSVSFSLKGFFPLWRFQQYKLVGDLANLVAGIEFLLGAFFVGLFIYVFRRRMEK